MLNFITYSITTIQGEYREEFVGSDKKLGRSSLASALSNWFTVGFIHPISKFSVFKMQLVHNSKMETTLPMYFEQHIYFVLYEIDIILQWGIVISIVYFVRRQNKIEFFVCLSGVFYWNWRKDKGMLSLLQ